VCCSVLQCAAVCCSVLQCVAVCCSVLTIVNFLIHVCEGVAAAHIEPKNERKKQKQKRKGKIKKRKKEPPITNSRATICDCKKRFCRQKEIFGRLLFERIFCECEQEISEGKETLKYFLKMDFRDNGVFAKSAEELDVFRNCSCITL